MVHRTIGVVGLLACLAVAGCSSASNQTAEPGSTVRLLAHDSFLLSDEVLASFTEQTGVEVEVLSGGDAGSMVAGAVMPAVPGGVNLTVTESVRSRLTRSATVAAVCSLRLVVTLWIRGVLEA